MTRPTGGLLARWREGRDRMIADPRFQDWAARFPLVRALARRQAAKLFDLGAGFVYAQILGACVELDLFELLRDGPLPVPTIAARAGLSAAAAERLVLAAAALGLLERRGQAFGLGMQGAALLGNPGVSAMIRHHAMLYRDLADPVALLRARADGARMAGYWAYASAADPAALPAEQVAEYSALMAASNGLVATQVLHAYDFRPHRTLLDVGGGEGAFLRAVGAAHPHLALRLFDLPAVAERGAARLDQAGLGVRTRVAGGDFFTASLPEGADIVSLVRVVHDHDDAPAMALLRNVRRALPAGGTLLIAEPMAGLPGSARAADAYFGFYLLAMGSGRARTPQTLCAMAREAGFSAARARRTASPLLTGLIVARA